MEDNNNSHFDINKMIMKLFYEYKYYNEEYLNNLLCYKDENNFHTPIAYEKMGISLLISILDYENMNPFTRVRKSEYNDVKGVRNIMAEFVYNSNDKYKRGLYYDNMCKNINQRKVFNSVYEKYAENFYKYETVRFEKTNRKFDKSQKIKIVPKEAANNDIKSSREIRQKSKIGILNKIAINF